MATNIPIPMKLTVVDDGGFKLVSSTRVNPWGNHCPKSNVGQATGENLSHDVSTTQNNFVNVSMTNENTPKNFGILPSVVDSGTIFFVNPVPKQVKKTPSTSDVVFVTLQPPLLGVPRLDLCAAQNRSEATSDNKALLAGKSTSAATQMSLKQNVEEVKNKLLPHMNQVYPDKVHVPYITQTLQQNLPQTPPIIFSTVKEQLSLLRQQQQQTLQDAAGFLKNGTLERVNGPVSSSPNSSRPNQIPSALPKSQQSCIVVKHIPNLLSNSRGKPSKQPSDVNRSPAVTQANSSINVVPSARKRGDNQPVYVVKPNQLPSKAVNQPNIFYLVSSPNHPPTLIPHSAFGQSIPTVISNQNSSSIPRKIPHTRVGPVSHVQNSPHVMCTANTRVVVKRTHNQEQGSIQQPRKKSKLTSPSEIDIKKEPEDRSEDVSSNMETRTSVQNPLPKHNSGVSYLAQKNQVHVFGGCSSGSQHNRFSRNRLTLTETISVKTEASNPSGITSQTVVTSTQVTKGTVATSNVAPRPSTSSMSTSIHHTNDTHTLCNNTTNHKQIVPMKTFIVTDKSGTTRVLKVQASTPASHLLYTISNQCKKKTLNSKSLQPNGGNDSSETSTRAACVVKKVTVGVKQGGQGLLKTNGADYKGGVELVQGGSKGHDGTNNVVVEEVKKGSLKTDKMLSKTNVKCSVDLKQRGSKSHESKSSAYSSIVTRSKTRNQKRVSRKRRRKKWAFCIPSRKRKRQTKYYDTTLDHSYSFQPKSCNVIPEDKSKITFKEMMNSTSINSKDTENSCNFEEQLTEEGAVLPQEVHNPHNHIKVTLPTVALKPLKLKPEDHFKTIVVSSEPLLTKVNQVETKNTSQIQDGLKDNDRNSDGLNFEDCLEDRKSQKLADSNELRNKGTVVPSKMPESARVSEKENVESEPEISIKCEDQLLQTPKETAHLEEQPEIIMEIPSDLSLMSGKDKIKILRERMKRREREIEALLGKSVKQESVI